MEAILKIVKESKLSKDLIFLRMEYRKYQISLTFLATITKLKSTILQ